MYRPPHNNNIVKSIRKKFENSENNKSPERKNGKICDRGDVNSNKKSASKLDNGETRLQFGKRGEVAETRQIEKPQLQRQLSDPAKRNIKRTPAFRVDKSAEHTSTFQRNNNQSTLYESKVKQFSAVKNNCDNNSNVLTKKSEIKQLLNTEPTKVPTNFKKPILIKSQSSIDFQYVRSKFSNDITKNLCNGCHDSTKNESLDLSLLYTEPIPKALRRNNSNCTDISSFPEATKKLDSIYNASTLKIEDKLSDIKKRVSLTDSLKVALSKPLPKGPAPKKPPRTFQAQTIQELNELSKNSSFLHTKQIEKKPPSRALKKADPKYMLIRLEDAVRNNKLKGRRQYPDKSLTSGEDSDDSMIVHTNSNRTLPRLPSHEENSNNSALNFNCLKPLRFAITNYEKIREPNSCFFVGNPHEPVYAEPYHYRKDSLDSALLKREGSSRSKQSARNSLYYMSTPVLTAGSKFLNNLTEPSEKQMSAENSSLSSFTSDADTSPTDESPKIRRIIECYESRGSPFPQNDKIISTNRLDDLKISLQQTLDTTFNNIGGIRDSDSENIENEKVSEIIRKFETYRQAMPKYCTAKISKDTLFYCCLIIEKGKDIARIKFKYPCNAEIPQNMEPLCFPESDSIPSDMSDLSQNYSLLITNDKGERTYGYCRRVLPEGSNCCLPLTYCILSKYRAPRFYRKILVELESRHGIQTKFRDELISQFYNQKFPKPGESIKINLANIEPNVYKTDDKENSIRDIEESVDVGSFIRVNRTGDFIAGKNSTEQIFVNQNDIKNNCTIPSYIVQSKEKNELILTLHPDTRFEDSDLKKLHQLPPDILLKIFSSMLLERKVILISSMISNLSSCIDSLQSILYPFTWHHTCIPVLPESLWDIVESPTPVLCGVMSNAVAKNYQIENGIVVDLDSMSIQREEGDENKILAQSMKKVWKRSLDLANKAATSLEYVHSVYLSDAYLQVFIMCFKDYKKYFTDGVFQKEDFIKSGKSKGTRKFLNMFTETYMFLAFIDTVINTPENLTEFDKKIEMYGSEDSNVILDKLLEWNK